MKNPHFDAVALVTDYDIVVTRGLDHHAVGVANGLAVDAVIVPLEMVVAGYRNAVDVRVFVSVRQPCHRQKLSLALQRKLDVVGVRGPDRKRRRLWRVDCPQR